MPQLGHATSDENKHISGGKAGDQTGKEVFIREWYNRPWNCVIEFKDPEMAEKAAVAMEHACANDHIGYDQWQRNTLLTAARKVGYDPGKVTKDVETDCSALVSLCCMYAGIPESVLYEDGNSCTTSTLRDALVSTGKVKVYTDSKHLTSGEYNKRGSILLYEGHHTAIQLEDGSKVEKQTTATQTIVDTPTTNTNFTSYIGKVTASALNVRTGTGTTNKIVTTYENGKILSVTNEKDGWGYVNNTGWVSLKYVQKYDKLTGKVTASALNVRKTEKNGEVIKVIENGTKVTIKKLNADATWGYDSIAKGWVSLKYIGF